MSRVSLSSKPKHYRIIKNLVYLFGVPVCVVQVCEAHSVDILTTQINLFRTEVGVNNLV